MTVSLTSETNQRIGREKATPDTFQRIVLPILIPATSPASDSPSTSGVGRP